MSSTSTRSLIITKATPSLPQTAGNTAGVPIIHHTCLSPTLGIVPTIGSGRFGSCTKMVYKDMFTVCVKSFPATGKIPLETILAEAAMLLSLNSCVYTPHCFGVCKERRAIVMAYISLSGSPVTLHTLLTNPPEGSLLTSTLGHQVLLDVSKGLHFIHNSGILHNDIKLDNIVIGDTVSTSVRAYIIDFGKACFVGRGKSYKLSPEEVSLYKREHTHIAPDLRDGHTAQSASTDVYSLGRVIKKLNRGCVQVEAFNVLAKQLLNYRSEERPTLTEVIRQLSEVVDL